jgi:voltage-gated potassium channel Kch
VILPITFLPWDWLIWRERPKLLEFMSALSYLMRMVKGGFVLVQYSKIIDDTPVSKQIFTICQTLMQLVYISAGLFMVVENFELTGDKKLYFHTSFYFVVVTLSTVGYGEITPETEFGKVMVMFVIIVTIVLIPK